MYRNKASINLNNWSERVKAQERASDLYKKICYGNANGAEIQECRELEKLIIDYYEQREKENATN